jgi:hypothetical protein
MSFTSHLFALAAGVAGVTLYQRARQSGALSTGGGSVRSGSGMTRGMSSAGGSDGNDAGRGTMNSSLEGADSPNTGERIGTQGIGQGPLSSDSPDGLRSSDNLFGSDSQSGSQARTPGMADLTRGA